KSATEEILKSVEVEGTDRGQHPVETRKKLERMGRHGDAKYLEVVLRCIDKRCAIRGLDAPKKIAPTDPAGTKAFELALEGCTDEELEVLGRVFDRQLGGRMGHPSTPQHTP
ncbi:MAG TPA: hypothetical protein VGX76_20955, partial [Pirellulales bacterium]|nr:hypothetical protein [Pirellulales bacterium]